MKLNRLNWSGLIAVLGLIMLSFYGIRTLFVGPLSVEEFQTVVVVGLIAIGSAVLSLHDR